MKLTGWLGWWVALWVGNLQTCFSAQVFYSPSRVWAYSWEAPSSVLCRLLCCKCR